MTAQEQVYESLMRLRGNPDFDVVMRHIESLREAVKEQLVSAPEGKLGQLQGQAQAYGSIIKTVKDAPTTFAKFKA